MSTYAHRLIDSIAYASDPLLDEYICEPFFGTNSRDEIDFDLASEDELRAWLASMDVTAEDILELEYDGETIRSIARQVYEQTLL